MRSLLKAIWLVLVFCAAAQLPARAAEFGTADEAVAMVRKAIAMLKDSGREKTVAEANRAQGRFVDRDLYIVIHDMNGKALANPVLPRMVDADLSTLKDVDGKMFIKERLEMLKSADSGWIEFRWPNSLTRKIERRATYFERSGELVFTCGILKH